jgi:hypothetical protein
MSMDTLKYTALNTSRIPQVKRRFRAPDETRRARLVRASL